MDRRTDGPWMHVAIACTTGWTDVCMSRWMLFWMDGQMVAWGCWIDDGIDGWIDGWMGAWMDGRIVGMLDSDMDE